MMATMTLATRRKWGRSKRICRPAHYSNSAAIYLAKGFALDIPAAPGRRVVIVLSHSNANKILVAATITVYSSPHPYDWAALRTRTRGGIPLAGAPLQRPCGPYCAPDTPLILLGLIGSGSDNPL